MGVLEDAIREHLDLKRRHGATEEELRQQEGEALGPTRRDVSAEPEAVADEPEEVAEAEELAQPEPVAPPPPEAEAQKLEGPPAEEETVLHEPDLSEPAPDETVLIEPEAEEDQLAEAVPAQSGDTPPRGSPAVTEDRDTVEEPGAEGGEKPEEEDVLEETPDFLQETPEHDRLWFEQRPPRDFDFD